MKDEKIEVIVALLTGVQSAIAEICISLDAQGVASATVLAQSLENAATRIPDSVRNRRAVCLPLLRISERIRGLASADADELRKILH